MKVVALLALVASQILMPAPVSAASEREICVEEMKKVKAEMWCDSAARRQCIDREGSGAAEWCDGRAYLDAEHKIFDARLNDMYRRVMSTLEEGQRQRLRESQRLWLQYHRAECWALSGEVGAAILRQNIMNGCINDFIAQRTKEIQKGYCQDKTVCGVP